MIGVERAVAEDVGGGGEATKLVGLLGRGAFEEADTLTSEMIAKTAAWLGMNDSQSDRAARMVRRWWLAQVGRVRGVGEAEQVWGRWAEAFGRARPGAEHKTNYELKWEIKAERKAQAAKPTERKAELEAAARAGRPVDTFFSGGVGAEPEPKAAPAIITKPTLGPLLPGFDKMPEPPKPPAGATPLERLTFPPGLLGHATDHAYRCTDLPDRQLALWGAKAGLGKIVDRRLITPRGGSTVAYDLLLAATGAGKEAAIQFLLLLLRSAGLGYEKLFQGGMLASVQTVEDLIRVTPNCLIVIDEFGRWFRMIQDQSGNVSELPGVLCKLWGQKPDGRYGLMRRANRTGKDEEVQIQWPTLALAGASVSEPFWDACGDEHISGGFLNRCLILDAGLGAMELVETTRDPEKLDDWMLQLMRKVTGGVAPEQGSMPIMTKDWIGPFRMAWDARAKEAYLDHVSATRKLPEGRKRDLSIRTPEIATRLATVCARWCGARNVELPHYEWGWAWAEHSRDMVLAGANERMKVERDFDAVCRHFKTLLADGPMKWMDIRLKSRSAAGAFGMELLDKAMNEMLETGEIREIDLKEQKARGLRGNAGAPGRWFELGGNGGRAN
jgi:hypothetical protein